MCTKATHLGPARVVVPAHELPHGDEGGTAPPVKAQSLPHAGHAVHFQLASFGHIDLQLEHLREGAVERRGVNKPFVCVREGERGG